MAKHGKKYLEAMKQVDKDKKYSATEAVDLLKKVNYAKFDATVEVAINLDVDPKQADQQIRGALVLPNGTGKTQKVIVFAEGQQAKDAEAAGADVVGSDDLVEKIQDGWLDFDVAVATPPMMAKVGRLGRVLGPKGLMPNPKTGTVTMDVTKAVNDIKAGQVTYRVDSNGLIHAPIGKLSFDTDKIAANFDAFYGAIVKARPASLKGNYVTSVNLTSTFGPGLKINA
ncbi:50S ribosomal protein L1 [Companilactobacillus paralimentarius DSM 13238 = JCM 10415]|jgi:ribosomal protein L1, bacterial/chloroplast|uniref:Large ribosomal subunit protein uL1 n=3 Tax=Companilactobacillus TaxID=2767879 RepID=A0A202FEA1_9LACO|nr:MULTISPECIES: 50S ribosomal protein L1 [Companilactobacillus]KAE9557139.1 50S ribosomal protein L1 [Companilactobacillus bobalius]KAE9564979.1 50S ribosomal protein L1 [Companilactobacillus paralimentarius]KRK82066.1 50S ribosomal protein L1 [Companilactobacillus bobalius DSM 19674]KRL30198.1 50S ribosomal protein L1 [Companilactobacillus paralimentarius DSM 13238 = JCM 10415]MDR4933358.1 50S ribosomal protein L1 [Companilactobacillus paralimentarius]